MKFNFEHRGGYLYIFTAFGEDDAEGIQIEPAMEYSLNVDTYTLEVCEQYSTSPEVYVLPKEMDLWEHDQVFKYLYNWAYARTLVEPLPTLESVLKARIQDAEVFGNSLKFGDEWEVRADRIWADEAIVTYMRWDTVAYHKDVHYVGRRKPENVWAVLFPERFKLDKAEERELAIAELELAVLQAQTVLAQKEQELKELKGQASPSSTRTPMLIE